MTLNELCGIFKGLGLPYAQVSWDTEDGTAPPPLPYVLIVPETSADVYAGGVNAFRMTPYRCELYTRGRDMALEGRIEDALTSSQAKFVRRTVPLDGGVLETTYTTTVFGR